MIEGTYESSDRKCAGAVQPMPVLAEFATACCWTSWSNLRRGTSPNAVSKCFKPMICQPRINWINVSVISEIGSVSPFFLVGVPLFFQTRNLMDFEQMHDDFWWFPIWDEVVTIASTAAWRTSCVEYRQKPVSCWKGTQPAGFGKSKTHRHCILGS